MNKRMSYVLVSVLLILFTVTTNAKGDKSRGKNFYQVCTTCHGEKGQGNSETKAPQLAGQFDWYLIQQLKNFKAGIRGTDTRDLDGAVMRPMASTLPDDQAIEDVVAYIMTMKPKRHKPSK